MIKDPAHLRTPAKTVISSIKGNYFVQDCNATPVEQNSPTKTNTTVSSSTVTTQLTEAPTDAPLE